jgi:type VI protein secretion system component VasK
MAQQPKPLQENRPGAAATAPKQPTVQVRQPPSDETRTVRTNDPVTNATETELANRDQQIDEEQQQAAIEEQERVAKRQQDEHNASMDLMKSIMQSNEGFIERPASPEVKEGEEPPVDPLLVATQNDYVYMNNVQSGPGGLEVQERVFLTSKGYDALRTAFGPGMGK